MVHVTLMFGFFFNLFFKIKLVLAFPTGNNTVGWYCCGRFLLVLECLGLGFRNNFYLSLVADEYLKILDHSALNSYVQILFGISNSKTSAKCLLAADGKELWSWRKGPRWEGTVVLLPALLTLEHQL